ncbi:MAG: gamma-glutamylcyclotransferase [Candidatus Binatia bacterium]
MTRVFVYGSLLQGFGNHVLLHGATCLGEATTAPEFTMVSLGVFPGVYLDGDTTIQGEVYEVDEAQEARLNGLEGVDHDCPERGLYRREFIDVNLEGYGKVNVLIYIYNGSRWRSDDEIVESGSWRQYRRESDKYYRYG